MELGGHVEEPELSSKSVLSLEWTDLFSWWDEWISIRRAQNILSSTTEQQNWKHNCLFCCKMTYSPSYLYIPYSSTIFSVKHLRLLPSHQYFVHPSLAPLPHERITVIYRVPSSSLPPLLPTLLHCTKPWVTCPFYPHWPSGFFVSSAALCLCHGFHISLTRPSLCVPKPGSCWFSLQREGRNITTIFSPLFFSLKRGHSTSPIFEHLFAYFMSDCWSTDGF